MSLSSEASKRPSKSKYPIRTVKISTSYSDNTVSHMIALIEQSNIATESTTLVKTAVISISMLLFI